MNIENRSMIDIKCMVLQWVTLLIVLLNLFPRIYSCKEPENADDLKIELYKEMQDKAKQMLIPEFSKFMVEKNMSENEERFGTYFDALLASSGESKRTKIYGNSNCGQCDNYVGHSNSTCPWHYVLDINTNRIPVNIVMAACTCQTCRPVKSGKSCQKGTCQEIVHTMPVLRKLCVEGTYAYMTHFERVAVGCTCERPQDINRRR